MKRVNKANRWTKLVEIPLDDFEKLKKEHSNLVSFYNDNKRFFKFDHLKDFHNFYAQRECISCQLLYLAKANEIIKNIKFLIEHKAEQEKNGHENH